MSWITSPPEALKGRDGTDEVMSLLAIKKISAFSGIGHGKHPRGNMHTVDGHTYMSQFTELNTLKRRFLLLELQD